MTNDLADLAEVTRITGWWDDPRIRREFARRWDHIPRRMEDVPPSPAPAGYVACPVPSAGRHVLAEGHMFTGDGRCWVPDER